MSYNAATNYWWQDRPTCSEYAGVVAAAEETTAYFSQQNCQVSVVVAVPMAKLSIFVMAWAKLGIIPLCVAR